MEENLPTELSFGSIQTLVLSRHRTLRQRLTCSENCAFCFVWWEDSRKTLVALSLRPLWYFTNTFNTYYIGLSVVWTLLPSHFAGNTILRVDFTVRYTKSLKIPRELNIAHSLAEIAYRSYTNSRLNPPCSFVHLKHSQLSPESHLVSLKKQNWTLSSWMLITNAETNNAEWAYCHMKDYVLIKSKTPNSSFYVTAYTWNKRLFILVESSRIFGTIFAVIIVCKTDNRITWSLPTEEHYARLPIWSYLILLFLFISQCPNYSSLCAKVWRICCKRFLINVDPCPETIFILFAVLKIADSSVHTIIKQKNFWVPLT